MIDEVHSAAKFVTSLCKSGFTNAEAEKFEQNLADEMCKFYDSHWYVNCPTRGSGYRCVRVVAGRMDPLLSKAAYLSGISPSALRTTMPSELTMWVDPAQVTYRIGEEGSIGHLMGVSDDSFSSSSSSSSDDSGVEDTPSASPIPCSFNSRLHHHQSRPHQKMSSPLHYTDGAPQPCSTEVRRNIYYSGRDRHYYQQEVM